MYISIYIYIYIYIYICFFKSTLSTPACHTSELLFVAKPSDSKNTHPKTEKPKTEKPSANCTAELAHCLFVSNDTGAATFPWPHLGPCSKKASSN